MRKVLASGRPVRPSPALRPAQGREGEAGEQRLPVTGGPAEGRPGSARGPDGLGPPTRGRPDGRGATASDTCPVVAQRDGRTRRRVARPGVAPPPVPLAPGPVRLTRARGATGPDGGRPQAADTGPPVGQGLGVGPAGSLGRRGRRDDGLRVHLWSRPPSPTPSPSPLSSSAGEGWWFEETVRGSRRHCLLVLEPPNFVDFTQKSVKTSGLQSLVPRSSRYARDFVYPLQERKERSKVTNYPWEPNSDAMKSERAADQ